MVLSRVFRRRFVPDQLAAIYVLAYLGWLVVRTPGTALSTNIGTFAFYPLGLAVAWANWRNARVAGLDRRTRLGWTFLALSALSLWVSGTAWAFYIHFFDPRNWPSWVEWLEFTQQITAITGYLLFPGQKPRPESRARFALDACLTVIAGFVLAFQFGFRISLREGIPTGTIEVVQSAVDWTVFAIASVGFLQKRDATTRTVMGILLGANTCYFFGNYLLGGTTNYQSGDGIDALWFAAWVLRWSAARFAWHRYHPAAGQAPAVIADAADREYRSARFAYLMVAGAFLLLIGQIIWGDRQYLGLTAGAAALMAAALVGRQLSELRQNRQLFAAQLSQERRFRSLVQRSSDVVLVLDRDGRVSYLSPSAQALFGTPPALDVGGRFLDLVPPEDREPVLRALERRGGDAGALEARISLNDVARELEIVTSDLRDDPAVEGVVLNCRDVTDRNELERQLRHAQKLDAVGHLAGGLAHDFNNVLTAIRGYTELLRLDLEDREQAGEDLRQIEEAVDRAAAVTRKLLAFSRNQPVQRGVIDLNGVVRDLLPLLRQLVTDRVEVDFEAGRALWCVKADPGQMEQVLLNLATNARDAMPNGGRLEIATANRKAMRPSASHPDLVPGDYVALSVADEGVGMTEEVQDRIFEPFFSTKPRERGMGLGLAMVHGIVTESDGDIGVDSTPGRGTVFTILLPRCFEPVPERTSDEAQPVAGVEAARTLLLVDDEASVRTIARRMLEQQGYRVIESEDGVQAVEVLSSEPPVRVDLLITDLVMPGLHGSELIRKFRTLRPGVPIVCITGFAGEMHDTPGVDDVVSAVISKPFSSDTLVRSVATALAGPSPSARAAS